MNRSLHRQDFSTKDIYIASTLIALGYNQYEIKRNGKQCTFVFDTSLDEKPDLAETAIRVDADEYWSGNLVVDPKSLFNAFKEIKTRMYGEVGNE